MDTKRPENATSLLCSMCEDRSMPNIAFIVNPVDGERVITSFTKAFLGKLFEFNFTAIDASKDPSPAAAAINLLKPATPAPGLFEFRKIPIRIIGMIHGEMLSPDDQRRIFEAIPAAIHEFRFVIAFDDVSRILPALKDKFAVIDVKNCSPQMSDAAKWISGFNAKVKEMSLGIGSG